MTDEQLKLIWKIHMGGIVCGADELLVLRDVAAEAVRQAGMKPETEGEKFDRARKGRG